MSKPWHDRPLHERLYDGRSHALRTAARILGYAGRRPIEFHDIARSLPGYDRIDYERAVRDLTDWRKREAPTPRYELSDEARKAVRLLLGPRPEDPAFADYWSREIHQPGMVAPWKPGMPMGATEAWAAQAEDAPRQQAEAEEPPAAKGRTKKAPSRKEPKEAPAKKSGKKG